MHFNFDKLLEPWVLSFTIGGKEYKVRQFELLDAEKHRQVKQDDVRSVLQFIETFFVGGVPPELNTDPALAGHLMKCMFEYMRARTEKNSAAVAADFKAQATASSTSGSPSMSS